MNVKFEKVETNTVKLEVTVEAAQFNETIKKAYAKNAKKFNIPGFRKGKAPMSLIKKMYGEGVFYEDAINICFEETYPEALKEYEVRPVDYPSLDIVDVGEGKDLVYTATVTVMPEIELGQYKGVEVKKNEYSISDEEVEEQLKGMAEKNARVEVKEEGTVEKGNITVIDFKGYVDGVAFEGGEGKDYTLEIGSGSFIGNFEDQLIGASKGENREVNVSFPENYGREDLNGKPAFFEVTIKEIKVKELPEIDDEFAQEVSEFETLDELKADMKKKLEEKNADREKREFEEAVISAVCDNANIEIPQVMVDKEVESMLKDMEMRLKYQGLDLETYYSYTNSSEEKMKEYMRDTAERKIKTELVIGKIAKEENVEVEEQELRVKAEEVAKQYGEKDLEKTVDLLLKSQSEYLRIDVLNEKVIKLLVESSQVIA